MEVIDSVDDEVNKLVLNPFSFSNVRRETLGETYKYWNQLLKSKSFENIENFKEIISPSAPLPPLEEKLRLILIDTLHLENEVVNVFLSQNDYSIKRVLRCKWFFRKFSTEFFTEEIFPRVSISLRFKIINRVSRYLENEEEAEKLFTFIKSNYDCEAAELLLPKCSSEFILNYCKNIRPLVADAPTKRRRVLYNICRRYPETGLQILGLVYDYKKGAHHNELKGCRIFLRYLAGNHTDLFIPYFKRYVPHIKFRTFSGKLSWKLALKLGDFLFESKELMQNQILHDEYFFPKLDFDAQIKYLAKKLFRDKNLTLDCWMISTTKLSKLLKRIPPNRRYAVITTLFNKVYNSNFQDHSRCWSADLLELLPLKDRQYFVETLEKFFDCNEIEFNAKSSFVQQLPHELICLHDLSVAFDKLKNLVTKAQDRVRRMLIVESMVKCCVINRDAIGLEKVVDYVATRHRNDDPDIIYQFSWVIARDFPADDLTLDICQKVGKLLLFCFAKGSFNSYSYGCLTERSIYMCLESNKYPDELIKSFFEFDILKRITHLPVLSDWKNKHTRTLILALGREIQRWIQIHPTHHLVENVHGVYISTCEKFNKRNKKHKVVLRDVPGLAEAFKGVFKIKYSKLGVEDWPIDTLETCPIHLLYPHTVSRLLCYLLKRNPEVIIKHLDATLEHLEFRFYPFVAKRLCSWGVNDKLKEITLSNFKNGDSFRNRARGLRMYSHVCTIEEFTDAVKEFIPQSDHVEEGRDYDFSEMQLAVPKFIKNIKPRWKNLNLILKFFRGDFLIPVKLSFYSCCYHSSVDFIVAFLKEHLLTVPNKISYTKDIIRLLCEFVNRSEKINFCLRCWEDNKDFSVRKNILQVLFKLFLDDPTPELFNALAKCILESEEAMFHSRPDLKKIPEEFVNDYTRTLWKFTKNTSYEEVFQRTILEDFNLKNINLLSREFCEEIIRDHLFNPKSCVSVEQFVACYCVVNPDAMNSRIEMIFSLMRESKADDKGIVALLKSIRSLTLDDPTRFSSIFPIFLKNWPNSQGLYEEKLLYIYHDLYCRILQTSKEPSVVSVEFGKQLRTLYSGMNNLKDLAIILIDTLKEFIETVKEAKLPLDSVLVARELIVDLRERTLGIVAIGALPPEVVTLYEEDIFNADGDKTNLNELIKILENMNDDILWIYFSRTFGSKKVTTV